MKKFLLGVAIGFSIEAIGIILTFITGYLSFYTKIQINSNPFYFIFALVIIIILSLYSILRFKKKSVLFVIGCFSGLFLFFVFVLLLFSVGGTNL
jgi:hypothetical protein